MTVSDTLHLNFTELTTAYEADQLVHDKSKFYCLMIGRSNVGKSSLINKLIGRKSLAKVSTRPGKTESINYYFTKENIVLVDFPGFGFAKKNISVKERWVRLTQAYFTKIPLNNMACLLVDSRRSLQEEDWDTLEYLADRGLNWHVLLTKGDKLTNSERIQLKRSLDTLEAGALVGRYHLISSHDAKMLGEFYAQLISSHH